MHYTQFEDVPVWQETRIFINRVYKLIGSSSKLAKDYSLVDQLKRAAFSISLNIAEGFERGSNKEFANFLNIAKGSAGECRAILYILLDNNYISPVQFDEIKSTTLQIAAHLANFRKFLLLNPAHKK